MNIPVDHDSEKGLLGCLMLDARKALPELLAKHPNPPTLFYDDRHKRIFDAIQTLTEARKPVDAITVAKLLGTGDKDAVVYLATLPDFAPSATNVLYHADALRDASVKREVMAICTGYATKSGNGTPPDELLAGLQSEIMAIGTDTTGSDFGIKESLMESVNFLETCFTDGGGKVRGLETGFRRFDAMTGGLQPGQLVIIGGRPAQGKTSLAMNVVEHVALVLKKPVGVFSMEMTRRELVYRMLLTRAGVPRQIAESDQMNQGQMQALTRTTAELHTAPLKICDLGQLSIRRLSALARRMQFETNGQLALLVVDYIQLMRSEGKRTDTRALELSEITGGLKSLAKELHLPIIALSQFSRDVEKDGRKPRLSDLRDSGGLEQDADLVCLIHNEPSDNPDVVKTQLILAKQRNGQTGEVPLVFQKNITKFRDQ
ncbi:MAG: replicative DNA helicase [Verrucomicrobiota bacterium]